MKYLLLAYGDEQQINTMSSSEREALMNACQENNTALQQSGYLLVIEEPQGSHTATTIRIQNGTLSIKDGPYAKTKEQIIGIFTITARDLNEAIQVAARMPQAKNGLIEVRPILSVT